jgi:hypothetical protein
MGITHVGIKCDIIHREEYLIAFLNLFIDNKIPQYALCWGVISSQDLLVILFLIIITTRSLLGRSLHVLALHSSRSATTKWTRQSEVDVLLTVNPDHE